MMPVGLLALLLTLSPPSGSIFYHPDHLGSSTVITNHLGQVVQRLSYKPFGEFAGPTAAPTDGAAIHHFFTGQELDGETNLYHLGARYYDPALGRFTSPDPVIQDVYDPQALNPYSYARNNPIRLIDPTGLSFHSNLGSRYGVGGVGSGLGDFLTNSPLGQAWQSFTSFTTQSFTSAMQSLNSLTTSAMQQFQSVGSSSFGQNLSRFGQEIGQGTVRSFGQGPFGFASSSLSPGFGPDFPALAMTSAANALESLRGPMTLQIGGSGMAGLKGGGVSGGGVVFAWGGSDGFQVGSYSIGGGGLVAGGSVSWTLDVTLSRNQNIMDLQGPALASGGSARFYGLVGGTSVSVPFDGTKLPTYTFSVGAGAGSPELHEFVVYTSVVELWKRR